MPEERNPKPTLATIALIWLGCVAFSLGAWVAFLDPAALPAEGSIQARLLSLLGSVVFEDPALIARVRVSRLAVLATAIALLLAGLVERRRVTRAVVRFWTTPAHPLNLAVFRLVVFWQVYSLAYFDYIADVVRLPATLQFPLATAVPPIGPLESLAHWPRNPLSAEEVLLAGQILRVSCFTGMIGLFSRASAALTALLFFGAWGAAQWYGKVDHHHHLIWFLLLLATSPSGDALSVDSLWRAWRSGRAGHTRPASAALAYGLPLRAAMALLGVLYLCPGLWKITRSGFDWFLGQTAYNQIYLKWQYLGGWTPFLRIDEFPLLVHGGAFATILFETSFWLLIFGRRSIYFAAIAGVSFHTLLNVFMRYGFESLRNCYVMFVNWHAVASWIGRRVFPTRLCVRPAEGGRQGSLVACARSLDYLGAIEWSATPESAPSRGLVLRGRAAWSRVARRIPLLWPLLPVLWLLASRAGTAPRERAVGGAGVAPRRGCKATAAVAALLLCGNLAAGAQRLEHSWPLACYPLFDGILPDSYDRLHIRAEAADGTTRSLSPDRYREELGGLWVYVLQQILAMEDSPRRRELLAAVWNAVEQKDPSLSDTRTLRFYARESWLAPSRWDDAPGPERLIHEVDL